MLISNICAVFAGAADFSAPSEKGSVVIYDTGNSGQGSGDAPSAAPGSTATESDGLNANPPPSGTFGSYFLIAEDMEGGTFTDSAGIYNSDVGGKFLSRGTEVRFYPVPDDGWAFKEWQVTASNYDYTLEFEDMEDHFRYVVPGYNTRYKFIVKAVFEYTGEGYPVECSSIDLTDSGSSISVDKTTASGGETITITVDRKPGTVLGKYYPYAGSDGKQYPRIRYEQNDDYFGGYVDLNWVKVDENTYTVTLPDRLSEYIEPTNKKIYVYAEFEHGENTITVDPYDDPDGTGNTIELDKSQAGLGETVTVSVTKIYATDFEGDGISIYWLDGEDQRHELDYTYTAGTLVYPGKTTDTYTFVMPEHDVRVSADFIKIGRKITGTVLDPEIEDHFAHYHCEVGSYNISIPPHNERAVPGDTVTAAKMTAYKGDTIGDYSVTGAWITWVENGETKRQDMTNLRYDENMALSGDFVMPDADVTIHMQTQPSYSVFTEKYAGYVIDTSRNVAFENDLITASACLNDPDLGETFDGWIWSVVYYENGQPVSVPFTVDPSDPGRISFTMPAHSVTVGLVSALAYVDRRWNGSSVVDDVKSPLDYRFVSSGTTTLTSGLWIVGQDLTFSNGLSVSGDVGLVLCDGVTLTVDKGLFVPEGSTLTVYGQSGGTGKLITTGSRGNAGIGGDIDHASGEIIIKGGVITATGGTDAAGIGGGQEENSGYGPITIYGGVIEAIAGSCAAGIGGGQENPNNKAGTITIYGGTVHARGGKSDLLDMNGGGAGIGSGEFQKSGMICIYGGTIRAEVEKSSEGAAIGSGGGDIKHPADAGPIYIYGGDVEALASFHGAAIGGGNLGGITLVRIEGGRVIAGTISTPNDHTLYGGAGIGGGMGAAQGGTVEITGGYVEAHSQYGAGIGGGGLYGKDGGEVIIKGGEVYATSCYAAGIGGGGGRQAGSNKQGNGGTVTITGGYVFAASEAVGAGIGGGATDDGTGVGGNGGTLTVEGGYVVSTSGSFSYDWVNYVSTDVPGEAAEGFAAALGALLGKLIFSDPEDVSSGAIGGAFKGNGGALIVRGGVVISNAGVGGKAVGGGSKSSSDGTISLPDNYAVKAGTNNNDAEYVNYDVRTESCRTHIYVEIRRCPHVNAVYTDITDTHHTFTCPNCGASQVTETHEYDDVNDHDCNRCGHERVFMTFDPGDGTGYMSRRVVGKGSEFTLPACAFTAPAGAVFAGWSCTVDGEVRVYPAGKKLNPETDIGFTAKWTADNRYNLWVNGVRVDSDNKNDILGDGSAVYDPDTFTLTLDGPAFDNVHEGALIYADGFDLTVTGTAVFKGPAFGYAIYVKAGALTVGGDLETAQTATVDALRAEYDVTVSDGKVTASGESHGILAGGDLIIRSEAERVEANGNRSFGYRQITIEEGLVVTEYTYATRVLPADIDPARVNHIVLEHGIVIIYELNGGELNGQSGRVRRTVDVDGAVVRPEPDPVRDGFTFVGWFADQGLTLEFDFEQRVTEDTTVYAKWTKAFTVSIEWQTASDDEPLPESVSAVLQHRENDGWRTVQTLALNAEGNWRGTFTYIAGPNDGAGDLFRIRELNKDGIVMLDRDDEYYASDVPSVILTVNGVDTGYLVSYDREENGMHTTITNQSGKVYSVELGWDIDMWDQDRIDEMEVVLQRRVNIFDWEVLQILTINQANNWSDEFEPVPVGMVNQTTGTFVQYKYRVRLLEPDDEEEEDPQPQNEEQQLQDAKERVIYDWLDLDKPFIKNMIELADPENLWTVDDTIDWVNLQAKSIFIPRSQFVAEIDEYTDGIGKKIEKHETQYDVKYSHDSSTHKTSITNTAVFDVSIFKRWINFEEDDMPDSVWLMLVSKVQEDYAEQLGLSEYNIYTPVATVVYGDQINLLSIPGGEDGLLNDAIKSGLKKLLGDGLILNAAASAVIKTVIQKYTNTGIAIAEVDDEGSNPLTDWWTWMGVKKYGAFGVPMDFAGTELVTGFMEIVIDAIIKALGIPKIHCPVMYDPINECWSIKGYALSLIHDYELTCNVINIKFNSDDAPTSISGKKTWEGDTEENRPSEIKIRVYAKDDGGSRTEITGSPVTVTSENDWSWSLDIALNDIAVVTEDGENSSVEYKDLEIEEEIPDGYEASYNGYDITNTYTGKKTVSGHKSWDDNGDADRIRPTSIIVRLFADGEEKDSKTVTAEDGWKWTFSDLPIGEGGRKIEYTIREDEVPGYTATIDGYNITNTRVHPTGELVIVNTVTDADTEDGFVFEIERAGGDTEFQKLTVVIHGSGSIKIVGVEPGTYRVTQTDWSWKYERGGADSVSVTVTAGESAEAVFENSRNDKNWLSDEATDENGTEQSREHPGTPETPSGDKDDAGSRRSRLEKKLEQIDVTIAGLGFTLLNKKRRKKNEE